MARSPGIIQNIPAEEKKRLEFITKTLKDSGEECFLVGGSVRDLYMGKIPKEYDLTTSADPLKVKKLFKRVIETGIQHGTVTVMLDRVGYEVTTYRSEQGYSDGRRPDQVVFGVSLSEDLKRRDFTMNALALDILEMEIIDEHGGTSDIENKIIRTIGDPIERFSEDGLRPIRGIRFASSLGFQIDKETEAAFSPTRHITEKIAVERFQVELNKILKSKDPSIGINYLIRYNYFPIFLSTKVKSKPRLELLPLFQEFIENNFWNYENLAWFFFLLIWMEDFSLTEKNNPLRNLKLSLQTEKESIFFLDQWNRWEELFVSNETPNAYNLRRNFLSPMRDFANKNPTMEDKELLFLMQQLLAYLTQLYPNSILSKSGILNSLQEYYTDGIPLVLSELTINGNWLKENFPTIQGKEIGQFLNQTLDLIWQDTLKNNPQDILTYLQKERL
ncbi:MAG: poly-A polymerase [Leptospira sp.]|nr:poly-A polymerase [Leptospira sp.]